MGSVTYDHIKCKYRAIRRYIPGKFPLGLRKPCIFSAHAKSHRGVAPASTLFFLKKKKAVLLFLIKLIIKNNNTAPVTCFSFSVPVPAFFCTAMTRLSPASPTLFACLHVPDPDFFRASSIISFWACAVCSFSVPPPG